MHSGKKLTKREKADPAWERQFEQDPIDLRLLARKSLIQKARAIIEDIASGKPYTKHRGKRMRYSRNIVSVPISRNFRLILGHTDQGMIVEQPITHEQYNVKKPGVQWLKRR